jgi:hypothetical protein
MRWRVCSSDVPGRFRVRTATMGAGAGVAEATTRPAAQMRAEQKPKFTMMTGWPCKESQSVWGTKMPRELLHRGLPVFFMPLVRQMLWPGTTVSHECSPAPNTPSRASPAAARGFSSRHPMNEKSGWGVDECLCGAYARMRRMVAGGWSQRGCDASSKPATTQTTTASREPICGREVVGTGPLLLARRRATLLFQLPLKETVEPRTFRQASCMLSVGPTEGRA